MIKITEIGWVPDDETDAEILSEAGLREKVIRGEIQNALYKTREEIEEIFPGIKPKHVSITVTIDVGLVSPPK